MLIETEKTIQFSRAIEKSEREAQEREMKERKASSLSAELRSMSRISESVERSKSQNRIGNFNNNMVSKISELSRIKQTTGTTTREEAADTIRQWKQER